MNYVVKLDWKVIEANIMNTSKNFFVIDNFNTVPVELLKYCGDSYILYDASIEEIIPKKLD